MDVLESVNCTADLEMTASSLRAQSNGETVDDT